MTYIDSNILIRIITGDSPDVASQLLKRIESGKKNEYIIEPAVISEVCFVLEFHSYAMRRSDIADALADFVSAPQIANNADIDFAIKLYKKYPKLDFTDCLLIALADANKASILSLDIDLNKFFATIG